MNKSISTQKAWQTIKVSYDTSHHFSNKESIDKRINNTNTNKNPMKHEYHCPSNGIQHTYTQVKHSIVKTMRYKAQ